MAKVTLPTITSGYGSLDLINDAFQTIQDAFDSCVFRDGSSPNQMTADLDMNGNTILNYVFTNDGWNWQGDWATATAYDIGDVVYVTVGTDATNGGASYYCLVAHTSGTFATDLGNSYWSKVSARGAAGATGAGTGDMLAANNLSDVTNSATARTNLGLDGASGVIATGDIADDAVTLAKLAAGTAGNLITYDASGDPAAVATGTAAQVLTSNGAGLAPTFQDNPAAPTVATQATMETATNITDMVTPGRMQYHPGMPKAWVSFDKDGNMLANYNVSGVTDTSNLFRVTFTTPMSGADYCVICTHDNGDSTSAGVREVTAQVKVKTSTYVDVEAITDSNTRADVGMYVVVFGDQ